MCIRDRCGHRALGSSRAKAIFPLLGWIWPGMVRPESGKTFSLSLPCRRTAGEARPVVGVWPLFRYNRIILYHFSRPLPVGRPRTAAGRAARPPGGHHLTCLLYTSAALSLSSSFPVLSLATQLLSPLHQTRKERGALELFLAHFLRSDGENIAVLKEMEPRGGWRSAFCGRGDKKSPTERCGVSAQ